MIKVTKMNQQEVVLNAELIECIQATPDTIITLTTDKKILVLEKVDEVVEKIIAYRRQVYASNFSERVEAG